MLSHDRAFNHLNYFRWGIVYFTDMKMLQEVTPTTHKEFYALSTSSSESSFNSVSPDMALEQTVNRDSKIKGQIVGVTGMEGTRDRWAPTSGSSFHRELGSQGSQRIERDENDVYYLIQCIETKVVNPFADIGQYEREKMPLINIATGTVAHLKFRNLYSVLRSKAG